MLARTQRCRVDDPLLLAELAWINIAVGNLLAAAGIGFYVWRFRAANA